MRARLRVAQSGLGRAGHWLVQTVAQALVQAAQGCGKGDSGLCFGREKMK